MRKDYILHLVSWYPSQEDEFDGDFIQRHIHCIPNSHVVVHAQQSTLNKKHHTQHQNGKTNADEYIQYFKGTLKFLNPVMQMYYQLRLCRRVIKKEGKPRLIHVHVALYAGFVGFWLSLKYNIPLVMTEHSTLYTSQETSLKTKIKRWIGIALLNRADIMLPVSNQLNDKIKLSRKSTKSKVIHNVVSPSFFSSKIGNTKDVLRCIHVSSLDERHKNISGMIDAFEQFQKLNIAFHWTIVGNYNLDATRIKLEQSAMHAENYTLLGPLSHSELACVMSDHDVFVLFSNKENFPCVLLEAQASGLRLIATDVGGVSEILSGDDILVDKADIQGVVLGLIKVSEEDLHEEKREVIRSQAWAKYSSQAIGKDIFSIYKDMI